MYPRIKATPLISEQGFLYRLENDEIEIRSNTQVPKGLVTGSPFSWGNPERCRLEIPDENESILRISRGYEWDGISIFDELRKRGMPTDFLAVYNSLTLVATIHHDALYEALRDAVIPPSPGDWEATYKWADKVQLEILKKQGKLNPTLLALWKYHLKKAKGTSARPRKRALT